MGGGGAGQINDNLERRMRHRRQVRCPPHWCSWLTFDIDGGVGGSDIEGSWEGLSVCVRVTYLAEGVHAHLNIGVLDSLASRRNADLDCIIDNSLHSNKDLDHDKS